MDYIACHFNYEGGSLRRELATEILIAELGEKGFESFDETESGVSAYIQLKDWSEGLLENVQILSSKEVRFRWTVEEIAQVNWNEQWEKNFEPIEVDGKVSIRAPFHEDPKLEYEIIIEPKMSFGTGHHETTHLMVQHLLNLDVTGRSVLDMGSGTGILAIFAELRGADRIDAIDIDRWCYENALENAERNKCRRIRVYEGDASMLKGRSYDLIIANINRNILLQDMETYVDCLSNGGILLLSGFYASDITVIDKKASSLGLKLDQKLQRNDWVALKYVN